MLEVMDGVTVLNVTKPPVEIALVLGGVLVILGVIVFAADVRHSEKKLTISSVITFVIGLGVMLVSLLPSVNCKIYEVIISDEVKFEDFCQRYAIISQRGEIYTIAERN